MSKALYLTVMPHVQQHAYNFSISLFHVYSCPVPGQPTLNAGSTTATGISISWSVPSGSVVTSFLVQWQRNTAVGSCPDEDQDSTTIMDGSMTTYNITGLEEDSEYSVTVTASNTVGSSAVSNTITDMTMEAGEEFTLSAHFICVEYTLNDSFLQLLLLLPLVCDSDKCDLLLHHSPVGDGTMYPSEWRHHWILCKVQCEG